MTKNIKLASTAATRLHRATRLLVEGKAIETTNVVDA